VFVLKAGNCISLAQNLNFICTFFNRGEVGNGIRLSRFLTVDVKSCVGCLYGVSVSSVAEVSEVRAASIFTWCKHPRAELISSN
jgi:hypothetical protein